MLKHFLVGALCASKHSSDSTLPHDLAGSPISVRLKIKRSEGQSGKPQVLVHSTYRSGKPLWEFPVFLTSRPTRSPSRWTVPGPRSWGSRLKPRPRRAQETLELDANWTSEYMGNPPFEHLQLASKPPKGGFSLPWIATKSSLHRNLIGLSGPSVGEYPLGVMFKGGTFGEPCTLVSKVQY